jgi:hypothetical protein
LLRTARDEPAKLTKIIEIPRGARVRETTIVEGARSSIGFRQMARMHPIRIESTRVRRQVDALFP